MLQTAAQGQEWAMGADRKTEIELKDAEADTIGATDSYTVCGVVAVPVFGGGESGSWW